MLLYSILAFLTLLVLGLAVYIHDLKGWLTFYNQWVDYQTARIMELDKQLVSPRQRAMEKAYRSQLKKSYKRQYRGIFPKKGKLSASDRGFFMHSFQEAQNQRHWLESLRLGTLGSYKQRPGEQETHIANHKRYLNVAKDFLRISPQLP